MEWLGQTAPVSVTSATDPTGQHGVQSWAVDLDESLFHVPVPPTSAQIQYFDVSDGTTLSFAEQGYGYTPRVRPYMVTLLANEVWWDDPLSVRVTSSDPTDQSMGLDPIPSANRAEFNFQSIPATAAPSPNSLYHTSAHEIAHLFWVNWCSPTNTFHDSRNAWCSSIGCGSALPGPFTCPVNNSADYAQRTDGVERFCEDVAGFVGDLFSGDPACTPAGEPPTSNGSIRSHRDPE